MCTVIQIADGDRVDSTGELFNAIGRHNAVFNDYITGDVGTDECLCHLDVEATAAKAGYRSRNGWDDACCDFIWDRT